MDLAFLDKIPLDQTAVTVAMIAIVLLFALISVVKGILKTILTLISLTLAAAAFAFGFIQSPPYVEKFIPEAAGWMPLVIGGVCALVALVLIQLFLGCLLYTSDAADDTPCVDLGRRHMIK